MQKVLITEINSYFVYFEKLSFRDIRSILVTDQKTLVSVIIPHYNSLDTLRKAILSAAVNDSIEVIVVDDKSNLTESQYAKIESFCSAHNAKFYRNTTEKKGAGVCRNIGLKYMTSDWLLLLDADDYFIDGWYEVITPYLSSSNDMVYFPPLSINLQTGKYDGRTYGYQTLVNNYLAKPSTANMTALKYRFCSSCSKLVKRAIFEQNNICFGETMVSEDVVFMTKCAYKSTTIAVDSHPIYMATRSEGSLTAKKSKKNFNTQVDVFIRRYHFLEERLSPEEFRQVHLSWLALAKIVDALLSGYGIKTAWQTYRTLANEHIKIIDKEMFYPINIYRNVKTEIQWHLGINKSLK